jgi:hypothetical protein
VSLLFRYKIYVYVVLPVLLFVCVCTHACVCVQIMHCDNAHMYVAKETPLSTAAQAHQFCTGSLAFNVTEIECMDGKVCVYRACELLTYFELCFLSPFVTILEFSFIHTCVCTYPRVNCSGDCSTAALSVRVISAFKK